MDSIVQSFEIERNGWKSSAVIDFTENKCCVLTGSNGGGKTLTLKMIKAAGTWIENPTRYNFHEMKNIAQTTGVTSIKIIIRTQIMRGHDSNIESIHWANNWTFSPNEALDAFLREGSNLETNQLELSSCDFTLDIAKLNTTEVFFGNKTTVNRQEALELHYMIRDKYHRSEKDKMLSELFEQSQNTKMNIHSEQEEYLPFDSLDLNRLYGPEVFEFSAQINGEIEEVSINEIRDLRIHEPHPHDVIGGRTIFELLNENGVSIERTTSEFSFSSREVTIRVPIMLRVDRNIPNVAADLDNIRNLNSRLRDTTEVLEMLKEGRRHYMNENNCYSPTSEVVLINQDNHEFLDEIDVEHLDEIDHQYLVHSEPFFPSWLAFNMFVGHIPIDQYLSSGQLQLLAMTKAVLATRPNSLIMIDEPELSLHIDWQRDLIQFFKTTFPKHHFVFSTHSPDILYNDIDHVIQIPPEE